MARTDESIVKWMEEKYDHLVSLPHKVFCPYKTAEFMYKDKKEVLTAKGRCISFEEFLSFLTPQRSWRSSRIVEGVPSFIIGDE